MDLVQDELKALYLHHKKVDDRLVRLDERYKQFLLPCLFTDERLADAFLKLFMAMGLTPAGSVFVEPEKLVGTMGAADARVEVTWQSTLALTGVTDLAQAAVRLRHGLPGMLPFERVSVLNEQGVLLLSHIAPGDTDLVFEVNGKRMDVDHTTALQCMVDAVTPK
jgi:hypothetical protein